jgi:hypothetical protein
MVVARKEAAGDLLGACRWPRRVSGRPSAVMAGGQRRFHEDECEGLVVALQFAE